MTQRLETSGWYSLGIPLYGVLLAVEALIARRRGIRAYAFEDTLSDLACGLGQLLFGLFSGPVILALYAFGYHLRLMTLPHAWWVWLLALVGVDACYYAYHRAGHRVAVLWAIHNVHHQSAELNFAVALRQTWVSDAYAIFFYWPLPLLLGVPEEAFFAAVAVLSLYQITLHSRVLSWRGFGFFNTPAHHGLHHATNDCYLDKNFGSMTLIWDRLFGTYAEPRAAEPPRYGSPEGLPTHDGVLAQVVAARRLIRRVARVRGMARLRMLFGAPGQAGFAPDAAEAVDKPGPAPRSARRYALAQFALVVGGAWLLLWTRAALSQATLAVAGVGLIAGLWGIGGVLDGRPGYRRTEVVRLGSWLVAGLVLWSADGRAGALAAFFVATAVAGLGLLLWLLPDNALDPQRVRAT